MRLKYKILWVENDSDWAESIEEEIKELVEQQYGFDYDRTFLSKQNDAILFNDYDLILMDLNLESEPTGDVLIKNIREREIYTDVIFYSADGLQKIKQKAHDLDLEGVYFASRDKDLFINKVNSVIKTIIHKVQDLNNLRGLVMAEVSELDVRMLSLIEAYYIQKGTEEKTKNFKKHLVDDVEKSTKKKLTESKNCDKLCTHRWNNLSIADIIKDFEFDSSRKARAIRLIIESEQIPYEAKNGNFYEDYRIDMLKMRNDLAHCVSRIKDGKEVLITKGDEMEFDDKKFKDIRKQIKGYNDLFIRIEATIK